MKNLSLVFFLFFLITACNPAKKNIVVAASYIEIQNQADDSRLNKLIAPYKVELDSEMNKVIGFAEIAMPKVKDMPETLLGNFVADLVLEFSKTIDLETNFCVLNNGGLRSSLPQGNITIGNIYELMPFDNEIVIVTLGGDNVEKICSYVAEKGGVPISGMTLKLEKMNGTIVPSNIRIGGEKISNDKTYKISTSDYLANGGDNMNFWSTGSIQTTQKKLRDAIIDFIRFKTGENKKLVPALDGRISYLY